MDCTLQNRFDTFRVPGEQSVKFSGIFDKFSLRTRHIMKNTYLENVHLLYVLNIKQFCAVLITCPIFKVLGFSARSLIEFCLYSLSVLYYEKSHFLYPYLNTVFN